ncbi:TetR/AcrR family transcriptional regulator [Deinococcus radiopugnans]|uniref:TetR/AcrR family transcriptional regulator n=1 Tax=Deinococcus radiopugnans TaxID=57497 RepID=UPI0036062206
MKVDRHEQDEARRDRIARAAFELFARSGLEATSAQDIARAAFVSRTNLYRYFPSKIHMLLAHFDKAVQASRDDALERLHAGANPQQVWDKVMARMADLGVRYRHLVGAVGQAVLGAAPLGAPNPRQSLPCPSRPAWPPPTASRRR